MANEKNYARFYTLLKKLPGADKETLVYCTTCGRTTSLREMTSKEYRDMCASMEELTGWKAQVKKARSVCLKLMQKTGIDTTDWQRVNDFCRHPRIAGKEFARLTLEELDSLQTKLRAIMRKGGLRVAAKSAGQGSGATVIIYPMSNIAES
ncbi:hypothetical protein [Segatella maculosa]|uniref:hypothetical protein n=1 Tax=Segatella maculosa TaxID=439703 RepID=UPI0028D55917|nr:hypothetical protein [Segatella maculosa]